MGKIYKISCQQCGYNATVALGSGRMAYSIEHNIRFVNEDEKAVLSSMLENDEIVDFTIENRLVRCGNCNCEGLQNKTIIDVTDKNGTVKTFGNFCNECGEKMQVYPSDTKNVICPLCSQRSLDFQVTGLWD